MSDASIASRSRILARVGAPTAGKERLRRWITGLKWIQKGELDAVCEAVGFDRGAFLQERRPYLSIHQVKQLNRDGFALGGHSCDHPHLSNLQWEQAAGQIVTSCSFIAQITGKRRVPFAIPFNGVTLSRDRLEALRRESGVIDLVYDTNNLRLERDWSPKLSRANLPAGDAIDRSNLEDMVRVATC